MGELIDGGVCGKCQCKLSTDGHCPRCRFEDRPTYPPTLLGRLEMEIDKWNPKSPVYRLLDDLREGMLLGFGSVYFSNDELAEAEDHARSVWEFEGSNETVHRNKRRSRSHLEDNKLGYRGEFAACKALGIEHHKQQNRGQRRGDIADYRADVKTIDSIEKNMIVRDQDLVHDRPCILVLEGNRWSHRLLGWGRPSDLIEGHEKLEKGGEPAWWVGPSELSKNWYEFMVAILR